MGEEHEEGVAFIGLHIEEEGEYGIALPAGVELHVLMAGGHEGHDHGSHDDHDDHSGHDDHDDHADEDDHDDHADEDDHDDHDEEGWHTTHTAGWTQLQWLLRQMLYWLN